PTLPRQSLFGIACASSRARQTIAVKAVETDARTPYAPSLARVPYTGIREVGEIAMAMDDVLRLYFGESNLPTPRFIVEAAARALDDGYTSSSENAGLPALRRAIASQYGRLHRVELDPEREIVVTASGVQALHLAIRSVLDPGDEALILSPAWPNGASIVALSHAVPLDVPLPLAGRCRPRRAVVLEELLHDRLARGLARDAVRPRAEARRAERVLRVSRSDLCPGRRAHGASRG